MARQLTFVVMSATRSPEDFEVLAAQSARLKARGRVEIGVNSLAERTLVDIPPGGSSWHDYTSMLPSLEKFFPHKDLQSFVDREHVRKNVDLLRKKLEIARRHGLGAAAQFHLPWYLPGGFFEKHPHLRGPRIDHPRRSRQPAFAICPDLPEGQAFYAQMFRDFAREVPELGSLHLLTNDAGGGLCWADWQYIGPNGPAHCRQVPVEARVGGLIDALRSAADGRTIDIDLRGNFSERELTAIASRHDEHFAARAQHGAMPRHVAIGPYIDNPVLGMFDFVAALKSLDRLRDPSLCRVIIDFSANYSRGHELHDVQALVIDFIDSYLAEPGYGLVGRVSFLRKMCVKWAGEEQADALLEALHDLHDALEYRKATVPQFTANYVGVSMRHINRPLVAQPEKLSPQEEAYWLGHVFNPSVQEARIDYIDFHGGRLRGPRDADDEKNPRIPAISAFVHRLNDIADRLTRLSPLPAAQRAAPSSPSAQAIFARMATSLRIYASILRSCGNVHAVQKIRDRNYDKFAVPRTPSKVGDWHGDADLQLLNDFMRDELDNTVGLIRLLEDGGRGQILTAADPRDEDTFLLGPNLIEQLRMKLNIMQKHWLDAEQHLATPHK